MMFTRLARAKSSVSKTTIALAAIGGVMLAAAALEQPAQAQYGPRSQSVDQQEKRQKKEEESKASYSKAFVEIYQPFAADVQAEGADAVALKARIPGLIAVTSSPDEKLVTGQLAYNIGLKAEDAALQRQGLDMMLASGKVASDKLGLTHFAAAQLAQNAKDFSAARTHYEQAAANGYSVDDSQIMIAETYFAEDNVNSGVAVLDKAIEAKLATGEPVPESWLKRGISMAYNAGLGPQSAKYGAMYARYYPSTDSWGDAIAIQRNLFDYGDQEILDLLRLAQRTGSLRNERDYVEYISSADPRRLPGEALRVIEAGLAAGKLKAGDVFVTDARTTASGRVKADRADLPALERDARAASATGLTTMAAGDAFLSYGEAAKAEEFYTIALAKPGVDTGRILTRLGIAQADQGKFAEAQATLAKVQGPRQPIAMLWAVYAAQKAGGSAAAPAAAQ